MPHLVAAIAYDGLCTFEFGCVVEVFALQRPELGVPWYRFAVCAAERGPLRAAGGIEAVFSVKAIHENKLPPTINYQVPDPECDLDYVPNEAREAVVEYALSNSFGFGGTNASLIFKRYSE